MTKMDEASNPCGGDIEAEMCQLMREQPPAEGVVDRVALQRHRNVALITLSHPQAQNALTPGELASAEAAAGRSRRRIGAAGGGAAGRR